MKSLSFKNTGKSRVLLVFLLFFVSNFNVVGQTVYEWYQDGIVIFQLKTNGEYRIPSRDKIVSIESVDFIAALKDEYGIYEFTQLHPNDPDILLRHTYQVKFDQWNKVEALISAIKTHPAVEYAEKKELHKHFLTPNDLGANSSSGTGMWHLYKISAQQAWDLSTGDPNIIVAVTDNAILTSHQDLQNKLVQGYDAPTGGTDPNPCGSNDGNHGTHVSGTVGAETNSGIGVSSIGYNVSIMPVKIGDCTGALTHGYEGINYAANNGADVINMSWGGGGFSNYGQNICNAAFNAGAILVAAAGNDGTNQQFYPAAYNNVIAVASTTTNDAKSSFSQYGTWITISAPGSAIRSTYATSSTAYARIQGTSMASPNVAGLVGLMKSYVPTASNQDIINCLINSADNIDAVNSAYIGQLGSGRINAFEALNCMSAFNLSIDAGITEIIDPTGTLCSNSFTPQVRLRNFGTNTLTSAVIHYEWNGVASTYNWTGTLTQGQSTLVTLPIQTGANGAYTFSAWTSDPNGSTDLNPGNDQDTMNFILDSNGQIVSLALSLDCYGSEVSWFISDQGGNTTNSGGGYLDNTAGQQVSESFCLSVGCYTFTINDSYGDGMYGSQWNGCSIDGDYALINSNGDAIVEMTAPNADFGFGTNHNFCVVDPSNFNDAGISQIMSPNSIVCANQISPVVSLTNYGNDPLTSVEINYQTSGGVQTFNWTGNLTTGQSELLTLPNIAVGGGLLSLIAFTSNPNGLTDFDQTNDQSSIQLNSYPNALPLPYSEDFENDVFSTGEWSLQNPDNDVTWEYTTVGGITPGSTALKIDFYNYAVAAQRDVVITPKISLAGYSTAELTFDHAYRRYNQSAADSLIVYVSDDCGQSWDVVLAAAENGTGSFATQTTSATVFTPSVADEWCFSGTIGASCFNIDLSAYLGQEIFVKFEAYNAGTIGNNLFIDNINIDGTAIPAPPIPNFTSNTNIICEGGSITFDDLSVSNITDWSWSFPGANPSSSIDPNPTVSYPNSGTFDVELTVTNSFGTETLLLTNYVTVNTAPVTSVTSSTTDICEGGSVQLSASGASTYLWNNGLGSGAVKTVSPLVTTTYLVTGSNGTGCNSDASITINVLPNPTVIATASQTSICSGESVQLTGNGAVTYTWDNGLGSGSSQLVSPTATTIYSVIGTNDFNCSNSATVTVTVNEVPSLAVNASSTSICEGQSTTISANGADNYLWSPASDLSSTVSSVVTANPGSTTTYTVVGSNNCGSDTQDITIVVNPIPAQPIVSQSGNTLSVVLQAGESAEWFYVGSSIGIGSSITITTSGTYEVIVTNSFGCQSNTISTYNVSEASISELSSLTSIEVYPNPTNGKFNVELSAKQNFEIYLTDLIGRQLSPSVLLNSGEHVVPFDVSDYSKGVYLIVFKTDNESFSTRILIQ